MTVFSKFRYKLIAAFRSRKPEYAILSDAIILNSQKTGKCTSKGSEVRLLLHVTPSNGRSYLQEYTDVYQSSDIAHFLQPGHQVTLEMNSIKGKAILSWKE